jgi:hypothetical protein
MVSDSKADRNKFYHKARIDGETEKAGISAGRLKRHPTGEPDRSSRSFASTKSFDNSATRPDLAGINSGAARKSYKF